jgi:hypothetical protein
VSEDAGIEPRTVVSTVNVGQSDPLTGPLVSSTSLLISSLYFLSSFFNSAIYMTRCFLVIINGAEFFLLLNIIHM